MAILIDIQDTEWMSNEELRTVLEPMLPGVSIRCWPELGDASEIEMVALNRLTMDLLQKLPGLRLVQKLGAGVETIVGHPDLRDDVRVVRLKPDAPAQEIAEYCLAYVLREQRHMRLYDRHQAGRKWAAKAPAQAPLTTVGVLGLGHIGRRTARAFAALDFRVLGWSRSPKTIDGVVCKHGADALFSVLGESDYVVSILPSTPQTQNLIDAQALDAMKSGAFLINAGRGDLIVDDDLMAALACGHLAGATLDVFREEPLPEDHPFWSHPMVTVTPHVSGWHLTGGLDDIAENYRRLVQGVEPLLHEVDRSAGY